MPAVDLLAVDLDFTLLDYDRRISPENLGALRRAEEAGIAVILASGRMAGNMRAFWRKAGLGTPLVSCNGAYVVDGAGLVIEEHTLPTEHAEKLIGFCRERGLHLNLYCNDRVFFAEESRWSELYLSRVQHCDPCPVGWAGLSGLSPHKLIVVADPAEMAGIKADSASLFPDGEVEITFSEPEYLEFLCPACSKGTGLMAVARALGVPRERTAAIGDYLNDIEMLKWVGQSAAVANALPEVKAVVDLVVGHHNEAGVASFVDVLLQNGGQCLGAPTRLRSEGA